jgi:zinc D-Ala-D-Ala dipeptidase
MQDGYTEQFDKPPLTELPPTINDERVVAIEVNDNHEPLVNLFDVPKPYQGRLWLPEDPRLDFHRKDLTDTKTPYVRESVRAKLLQVLDYLPGHIGVVIIEPYRSVAYQTDLFNQKVQELIAQNIDIDQAKIEAAKYVSNPAVYSPHTTGGALDVHLFDLLTGHYLNMGNWSEPTASASFDYPELTQEQTANRELLKKAMESAGFVNYPYEWWHWSYGDKYWAYILGQRTNTSVTAIYGPVDPPQTQAASELQYKP